MKKPTPPRHQSPCPVPNVLLADCRQTGPVPQRAAGILPASCGQTGPMSQSDGGPSSLHSHYELCETIDPVHRPPASCQVICYESWRGEGDICHCLLISAYYPYSPAVMRGIVPEQGLQPVDREIIKGLLSFGKGTQSLVPVLTAMLIGNAQIPVDFRISYSVFPARSSGAQAGWP